MQRAVVLILCAVLGVAIGFFLNKLKKEDTAEAVNVAVVKALKENPKLLVEALKPNAEDVFDMVIEGQNIKREKAARAQQEAQLKNPLKPVIEENRPMRGAADAPITIVEYSDFECPFCGNAAKMFHQVMAKYPGKIRLYFKHMIIRSHQLAPLAAAYFEAASLQSMEKAWAFHDAVYNNAETFRKEGDKFLKQTALAVGLDLAKLDGDAGSKEVQDRLARDRDESEKLEIPGTPSFVVNGVLISGAVPLEEYSRIIDMVLAKAQKPAQPAEQPKAAPSKP
jgi:protein-disulfide isomerase